MTATPTGRAEKSSNFFLGFLFLSKEKRDALSAVYSYCRTIDDIVDSGIMGRDEAGRQLDFWRAEVDRLYDGQPTHPVAAALAEPVRRFKLSKEPFMEMIRGCRMDLDQARYETFEELESYMRGVACSVGTLAVEIFGCRHTSPEKLAEFVRLFGYAFQLTNIIRDVGVDLELGRVYLPESDMRQAGYSREDLMRRDHNPAFDRLMRAEYERARGFYQTARACVDFRDRPALLAAEVMAHIYEGVLEEIRLGGFRVLFKRTRLSPWRKLKLASKAWLYCHGRHRY